MELLWLGSVDDEGRLALWLVDVESSKHGDVINEILVDEGLAEWNVKDIGRLIKQYGGEIGSSRSQELDAAYLVLDLFEQIEACGKEKTSTLNDDKHDCG